MIGTARDVPDGNGIAGATCNVRAGVEDAAAAARDGAADPDGAARDVGASPDGAARDRGASPERRAPRPGDRRVAGRGGAVERYRKLVMRYGIAVAGLAVLAVVARRLDGRAIVASLREMNPVLAGAAMAAMIGGKVGFKVLRSQRLLVAECARVGCVAPPLATTARLLAASHAAGQLAWGPLGFTVRTVALRADGMPLGAIARVHVAERIAEAIGIAAVALAALAVAPAAIVGSRVAVLLVGGFVALAAVAMVVAAVPRWRRAVAARAPVGVALGAATLWALASSVADIAVLWLAARAMHVDVGAAPLVVAFLAVNGACVVPVTPAQIGVQEAAITVAFATAGIPAPVALACALGYRCAHLVPLALIGVPALIATWAPRRRSA